MDDLGDETKRGGRRFSSFSFLLLLLGVLRGEGRGRGEDIRFLEIEKRECFPVF